MENYGTNGEIFCYDSGDKDTKLCYLWDKGAKSTISFWTRLIGFCFSSSLLLWKMCCVKIFRSNSRANQRTIWKHSGRIISLWICIVSIIYLIFSAVYQSQGSKFDEPIGDCDINLELLSSKTGYIKEWWNSKLSNARKIALL
jgi:hypothetical protein